MTDIPDDIMSAARKVVVEDLGMDSPGLLQTSYIDCIAEAILAERERSRQLLSEAQKREREARAKALEEAAQVADDMPKFLVKSPVHVEITSPKDVAERIRALQSEER